MEKGIIVPHIWIPRVKTGELLVESGPVLHGEFELSLRDKESGKVRKHLAFHNLILNKAFDAILSSGYSLKQLCGDIHLGTGVTPPQPTDTALANPLISKEGTVTAGYSTSPLHAWARVEAFFDTGEANGDLSEIGMGAGSSLYARELIRDANGNPVVITKTNQDTLSVSYTIKMEPPALGYTESIFGEYTCRTYYVNKVFLNWSGANSDYYARVRIGYQAWCTVGNGNAPSSPNDAEYAVKGTSSVNISGSSSDWGTYVNGQLYRDRTLVIPASMANFAEGIGEVIWSTDDSPSYRHAGIYGRTTFSPQIPKTSAHTLHIQHRISFTRG